MSSEFGISIGSGLGGRADLFGGRTLVSSINLHCKFDLLR